MQRDSNRKIALERIEILFNNANEIKDNSLADRYIYLARKIAMRYNIKIPSKLKRKYCHSCYNYFYPARYKVRTNPKNKAIEYTCLNCKKITRFGYKK